MLFRDECFEAFVMIVFGQKDEMVPVHILGEHYAEKTFGIDHKVIADRKQDLAVAVACDRNEFANVRNGYEFDVVTVIRSSHIGAHEISPFSLISTAL